MFVLQFRNLTAKFCGLLTRFSQLLSSLTISLLNYPLRYVSGSLTSSLFLRFGCLFLYAISLFLISVFLSLHFFYICLFPCSLGPLFSLFYLSLRTFSSFCSLFTAHPFSFSPHYPLYLTFNRLLILPPDFLFFLSNFLFLHQSHIAPTSSTVHP